MTHVFDEAVALTPQGSGGFRAHTHPAYNNMVGPFGGITAGTVVAALQEHPQAQGQPLSLTLNYAAPISEGAFDIDIVVLKTNRTNQHFTFTITQADGPAASGTAVFGTRRETWDTTEAQMPEAGAPQDHPNQPFPEFIAWAQNYETRFVRGSFDIAGPHDSSESTLWMRDTPPRPLDYPALASLSDAFFPRIMLRRGEYVPAGTISITTYFHASTDELAAQADDYILGTVRAARFGHGHFDHYGQLWGRNGILLATTNQLVYYKAPKA